MISLPVVTKVRQESGDEKIYASGAGRLFRRGTTIGVYSFAGSFFARFRVLEVSSHGGFEHWMSRVVEVSSLEVLESRRSRVSILGYLEESIPDRKSKISVSIFVPSRSFLPRIEVKP